MAEDSPPGTAAAHLDPDAIVSRSFTRARRGLDADEVRAHLLSVAEQVRHLETHRADLERRLAAAEAAAARAEPGELDAHEVARLLGEETARVLETAREAAAEIRAKATSEHDRLVGETREQAATLRSEASAYAERVRADADEEAAATRTGADTYAAELRRSTDEAAAALRAQTEADVVELRDTAQADADQMRHEADEYARRVRSDVDDEVRARQEAAVAEAETARAEADAAAVRTRDEADDYASRVRGEADEVMGVRAAEAEAEAERIRRTAELERDELLSRAAAELRDAEEQGKELVEDARQARERVLGDLARRRRAASVQLEQLEAARERILAAYAQVRESVDAATGDLGSLLPAAKRAADDAVRRAEARPLQSVADLEAELAVEHEQAPAPTEPAAVATEEPPAGAATAEVDAAPAVATPDEPTSLGEAAAPDDPLPPAAETDADDADDAGRGRSRRRRRERRAGAELPAGDTGELPAVEPSAEFEEVRLLAPTGQAASPEAQELPGAAPEAARGEDEVGDLFARLRAEQETPTPTGDTPTAADAAPAGAGEEPTGERAGEAPEAVAGEGAELLELLERRDHALAPAEAALAKALKRVLSDEQSRILDALRKAKGVPTLDELVGGASAHADRYRAVAIAPLGAAWEAGAGFAAELDPTAAAPPEADVGGVAGELCDSLVGALRDRLDRCLVEDRAEAGSGDPTAELELADRVRACYREWRSQRLTDAVGDAAVSVFNAGQFAALPAGCQLSWCVDANAGACPDAEDNSLAGAVAKGAPFPTGHVCPPAHPGCRCLLVPVAT